MGAARTAAGGFTLLEILVAFALLALSLGVLMQIFSGSMRNAERVRENAQATALAQSLLAGAAIDPAADGPASSGVLDDKYAWRLEATPYGDGVPSGGAPSLWQYTAHVAWTAGNGTVPHDVTLTTLRLRGAAK